MKRALWNIRNKMEPNENGEEWNIVWVLYVVAE
jgi:hypothetical protein